MRIGEKINQYLFFLLSIFNIISILFINKTKILSVNDLETEQMINSLKVIRKS